MGGVQVIVRVLQARVAATNVASFNLLMRRQVELLRGEPGLEYVKLARRLQPDGGEEVLLFEEWLSTADVYRWAGPNLGEPRLVPGALELIDSVVVSHYEALDRDVEAPVTFAGTPIEVDGAG